MAFTTLAAVKAHLGITGTDKDVPLQAIVDAVNLEFLKIFCLDSTDETTYTERHDVEFDGQTEFALKRFPVTDITSLTIDGSVADSSKYGWDKTGHIRLDDGLFFVPGRRKATAVFKAGWASASDFADLSYAALVTAAMTWTTDENPGVKSETIGRYRYELAGSGAGTGGVGTLLVYPPSASRILANHRRPFPVTTTLD